MHEEDESTTRNAYKVRAFTSAIKVINQLDHPLRSVEEARHVRPYSSVFFFHKLTKARWISSEGLVPASRDE